MYKIELFENELKRTNKGREILELLLDHADEVNHLINHNREIIVTWKRNQGPAFFAHFMESGFNPEATVPKEIGGIRRASFLRRMAVALQDQGSKRLVKTIDEHLFIVLEYTESFDSLHQIFQKLRQHEEIAGTTNRGI